MSNRKADAGGQADHDGHPDQGLRRGPEGFPQFNTSLDLANARQLIFKDYVHIGVAVDTPAACWCR